jgi:hypothetical protein
LTSFDEVRTYAEDIKRVVTERKMPPWKPVEGFGEFRDSCALTADERQTLINWVDDGAPEGDAADLPPAEPVSDSPWHLGEPDLQLTAPQFTPPERSRDIYRCFVLPVEGDGDRYLSAIQALPGNPQIVHHVLFYIDNTGEAEELDAKDEESGYSCFGGPKISLGIGSMIGAWAPGSRTRHLPEGHRSAASSICAHRHAGALLPGWTDGIRSDARGSLVFRAGNGRQAVGSPSCGKHTVRDPSGRGAARCPRVSADDL